MANGNQCLVCGRTFSAGLAPQQLAQERRWRETFVASRAGHPLQGVEAMDLTLFMHDQPARLLCCEHCNFLQRDEPNLAHYDTDTYDTALMQHLYHRYRTAFAEKQAAYQPLLRASAEVLEVGSHLGAFLETAEQWGWRPTGLDIGDCTSAFARQHGLAVKRVAIEDHAPKLRRPEAIFIWNCFEQLDNPSETLQSCHRLLDRHGLLIVRVPNAAFYLGQRRRLLQGRDPRRALRLLGYNNLLGFPYLHGFNSAALRFLLRAHGFEPMRVQNASLLTPQYPDMSRRVEAEWAETRRKGENPTVPEGPWIEMVARRVPVTGALQ